MQTFAARLGFLLNNLPKGLFHSFQKVYICLFVHTNVIKKHTNNADMERYFPLKTENFCDQRDQVLKYIHESYLSFFAHYNQTLYLNTYSVVTLN